ncbi:MAG: type 2 isopentenyl-diphosphate Delta-isomerase [Ktedonobacterales bacterium]
MADEVKQRKIEHVTASLNNDVSAPQSASWTDVRLIHRALPEVDLDQIDLSVTFLGKRLRHPIVISSLTGGHPDLATINSRLAMIAQEYGLAMGVGSQRAAIVNPSLAGTYQVVRQQAPQAFLIANLGVPQLIAQKARTAFTLEQVQAAIQMIGADALALHMNFLQEATQPEGDRKAYGCLSAVRSVSASIGVPVIAKETGAGVSYEQGRALKAAGVSAIDVGGAGGSSMAAMESVRAESRGDTQTARLGQLFRDWGIPTPITVVEARQGAPDLPIISTGGVRNGLDAARALALGASLVGMGFPFLKAATQGETALRDFLEQFLAELKVAMQLSGASTVAQLQSRPIVVTGASREWLEQRGFGHELRAMARRAR